MKSNQELVDYFAFVTTHFQFVCHSAIVSNLYQSFFSLFLFNPQRISEKKIYEFYHGISM